MINYATPWVRTRGMNRILAQETNVSDLIQFLSDRDLSPWKQLVGFIPDDVSREAENANHADLLLTSGSREAVIEVKLGHLMGTEQQKKYEALPSRPDLYLAALSSDEARLKIGSSRWSFLNLSELISRWARSDDDLARHIANEAAGILRGWDQKISGVFGLSPTVEPMPLTVLNQKFLGRVVTRRVAHDLRERGRLASAGVTSGGGLPLVQGWTPLRGEGKDRTFIAEVRWWATKPGGELRFGVDFDARPDRGEDEEVRRAAYGLARSMEAYIEFGPLKQHLAAGRPNLAELLRRDRPSRPTPKDGWESEWERVIVHGFAGATLSGGAKNNRQKTAPDFFGDGALRFQAIAEIDFDRASARDLTELIDGTLDYLTSRQP